MSNPNHFDVIVIGSGSGSKITRPAANLGNKVAIIEKGPLGGTCLNRGCIPSKMLIHPADVITEIENAKECQISVPLDQLTIDKKKLVKGVCKYIDEESLSINPMYEKNPNITHFKNECAFVDNNTIRLRATPGKNSDNDQFITGSKIFLVAGVRPMIPDIPGLKGTPYLTYKEVLRLEETPKSVIVVGGGYIASELGYFLGKTGTKVNFLVRSGFVGNEDFEIRETFEKEFKAKFECHFKVSINKVEYDSNKGFKVFVNEDGKDTSYEAEGLFIATGVIPNTDVLEVKNTSIKLDKRGYVVVNEYLNTDVPHIWSWGDIIGRNLFRHTANFEGEYAFRTVFEETPKGIKIQPIDYPPVPHAIFSNPQIGGVGLTEQAVKAKGIDYIVGMSLYRNSAMGSAIHCENGFVKLIFDKNSRKLLGAHIIGPEASDMVHMCIAFMQFGATIDDMLRTIYIHPALPEIVRNAARNAKPKFDAK